MGKRNFDKLKVDIWVSGTADKSGNGGYSAMLYSVIDNQPIKKTIGGYAVDTTLTRMTLKAIVESLRCIKNKSIITIYTSIPQVSAGLNKNMYIWEKKGWHKKNGGFLRHSDLWQQVFHLLEEKTIAYKVKYEKQYPSQDNQLYVLHSSSKYAMQARTSLAEVSIS